jgi:uncharacterized cupredoxin-like copper-binding protein
MTAAAVAFTAILSPAWSSPGHSGGHASPMGKAGDKAKVTRTVEVVMNDQMRFVPASVTVRANETVRFVVRNVGQIKHEFMLGTQQELVEHAKVMQQHPDMEHDDDNAVSVEPGATKELIWQFGRAGNYKFGCLVPGHFEQGMVGNLTVNR